MADKDTVSKRYLQNNGRFADLFNFFLYNGRQVIQAQQLKPLDTTAITLPYGQDGKSSPVQKYRDIIKVVSAMSDEHCTYMLLATELQSERHYAMPVRNMLYDAIQYTEQVEAIAKAHRKNKDKPTSHEEFLSGFYKTDKLIPVITLTVCFSSEQWNAPKSLHEMLLIEDSRLVKFIPDYKLNLIIPSDIEDTNFSKFKTELGIVLEFIKCTKDKGKMKKLTADSKKFESLSRETAEMMATFGDFKFDFENGKETVNMCKAFEDWSQELLSEGEAKGKAEGILVTLADLVKKTIITPEQAAEQANMSVEEFIRVAGLTV